MAKLSDYTTVTGGDHEALAETLNSIFNRYPGTAEDVAARKAALLHLGFPEGDVSTLEAHYTVIHKNDGNQYDGRQDTPFEHDQDLLGGDPQLTADVEINHDRTHIMGATSVGDKARQEVIASPEEQGRGEDKPGRTDPTAASIGSSTVGQLKVCSWVSDGIDSSVPIIGSKRNAVEAINDVLKQHSAKDPYQVLTCQQELLDLGLAPKDAFKLASTDTLVTEQTQLVDTDMSQPLDRGKYSFDKQGQRLSPQATKAVSMGAGGATVETSVATSAPERRSEISKETVKDIVTAGAGSVRAQSKENRAKNYAEDVANMGEQFSSMKERESAARKRMEELHKAQREEDAKNSKDGMKYGMAGAAAIFALMKGAAGLAMFGPILGPVLIVVAIVGILKFGYEATKVVDSKIEQYQDKQELKDHFKQEKESLKDLSKALTSSRNADNEVVDKTMGDGVMSKVAQQEGVAPGAEAIGEVVGARLAQTTGIQRGGRHHAGDDTSALLPASEGDVRSKLNDLRHASGPDQRGAGARQALQEQVLGG